MAKANLKVNGLLELVGALRPQLCQLSLVLLKGLLCQCNLHFLYAKMSALSHFCTIGALQDNLCQSCEASPELS